MGIEVSERVESILTDRDFVPTMKESGIDLVKLTVLQLGFRYGLHGISDVRVMYERIESLGLKLCSPDVGPEIRIQYKNQPERDGFCIGMKPIWTRKGSTRSSKSEACHGMVFCIGHDSQNGMWLDGNDTYDGLPDRVWSAHMSHVEHEWVFIKPK